ncbi:hypothetical protein SCP_1503340 [Sparassis crispa]|uniref:BTB domain-containing protein n=1 Tax=Sparassis crispa TaxID=139825 RepID=A0A401H4F2_9APHY|nr:hypothetical protein SCP_1503340 [Sparassis crispa]GBE89326.1 hypothetical protein SCP_1503340 [Sparassis crispa]
MNSISEDAVQQDADFWFEDGNIVLIANRTAFRVHQGVLSRHSEVLRSLLILSQPVDEETMFGCPSVHMSDSPTDLQHLLRVLYDSGMSYFERAKCLEFSEVAALVRLSHKYGIKPICRDGLARMKTIFTDDFSTWTDLQRSTLGGVHSICSPVLSLKASEAIMAVSLARLTDSLTMLPTALYICCLLQPRVLLQGATLSDGSSAQLSAADLELCVSAIPTLTTGHLAGTLCLWVPPSPQCSRWSTCANSLRKFFMGTSKHVKELTSVDVLGLSSELIDVVAVEGRPCADCTVFMKSRSIEWHHKFWDDLPSIFGLDDWSRLRESMPASSTN